MAPSPAEPPPRETWWRSTRVPACQTITLGASGVATGHDRGHRRAQGADVGGGLAVPIESFALPWKHTMVEVSPALFGPIITVWKRVEGCRHRSAASFTRKSCWPQLGCPCQRFPNLQAWAPHWKRTCWDTTGRPRKREQSVGIDVLTCC